MFKTLLPTYDNHSYFQICWMIAHRGKRSLFHNPSAHVEKCLRNFRHRIFAFCTFRCMSLCYILRKDNTDNAWRSGRTWDALVCRDSSFKVSLGRKFVPRRGLRECPDLGGEGKPLTVSFGNTHTTSEMTCDRSVSGFSYFWFEFEHSTENSSPIRKVPRHLSEINYVEWCH